MRTREDIHEDVSELTQVLIKAHKAGWVSIDVLQQVHDSASPAAQQELDELYTTEGSIYTHTDEACPECGVESYITTDGKATCPECGHRNMLPCSICEVRPLDCNWDDKNGCTSFPRQELDNGIAGEAQ